MDLASGRGHTKIIDSALKRGLADRDKICECAKIDSMLRELTISLHF